MGRKGRKDFSAMEGGGSMTRKEEPGGGMEDSVSTTGSGGSWQQARQAGVRNGARVSGGRLPFSLSPLPSSLLLRLDT